MNTKEFLNVTGMSLITVALVPTPDDITIVSPLAQLGVGILLIIIANFTKG